MGDETTIYSWLDELRERPSIYVRNIIDLENLVFGYNAALFKKNIIEPCVSMWHFRDWLGYRTSWGTNCGWARAIGENATKKNTNLEQLEEDSRVFFSLLDEYRLLSPTVVATVKIKNHHISNDDYFLFWKKYTLMDKPTRVDIIRLNPEPLHFMRYHYGEVIIDNRHLLWESETRNRTTVFDAKRAVKRRLQVKRDDWDKL